MDLSRVATWDCFEESKEPELSAEPYTLFRLLSPSKLGRGAIYD